MTHNRNPAAIDAGDISELFAVGTIRYFEYVYWVGVVISLVS